MKTQEELQAAVDEIREVCNRHAVVLVGTCSNEGIYGEITIGYASQKAIGWTNVRGRLTNRVDENAGEISVDGIGDIIT